MRASTTTRAPTPASPSGPRGAAPCASSSRSARSSRPIAAARAPAPAGTSTAPTTRTLTATGSSITITWSGMQREQGGTSPAFNRAELMGDRASRRARSFDFWIDEVAFTRTGGNTGTAGTTGAGARRHDGHRGDDGRAADEADDGRRRHDGHRRHTGSGGTYNEPMPPAIDRPAGSNAWASRYWDCCKPACGWTANVSGGQPDARAATCRTRRSRRLHRRATRASAVAPRSCAGTARLLVGQRHLSYGFVAASGDRTTVAAAASSSSSRAAGHKQRQQLR